LAADEHYNENEIMKDFTYHVHDEHPSIDRSTLGKQIVSG